MLGRYAAAGMSEAESACGELEKLLEKLSAHSHACGDVGRPGGGVNDTAGCLAWVPLRGSLPRVPLRGIWHTVRIGLSAQDIIFYQLPEHSHYYSDIVNMLGGGSGGDDAFEAAHATVTVLFSPLDAARLERVVGSARVGKMLKGGSKTFLFC